MDVKKVNLYLEKYGDYFNASQLPVIREALCSVPDKYFDDVTDTKLLNPAYIQIASAFGGVLGWDRFLIGDRAMGFVKMFLLGGCGIIALIDLFTIQGKTRNKNYEKIMKCIASVSSAPARPVAPVVPVAPPVMAQVPVAPKAPVVPASVPVAPKVPVAPVAAPVTPKTPVAPVIPETPVATAAVPKPAEKKTEPKIPAVPTIAPTPPKK